MPRRNDLHRILIIGQACEFDYSETQPRRVRASALPPGLESPLGVRAFCPARSFTSVAPFTHRIFRGAL